MARRRRSTPKTRKDTSSKAKKVTKIKKAKVEKPFNAGTMTSAAFWGWIRSALRKKSVMWKPILKVKNDAKIPYIGPNTRRRFSYLCNGCGLAFASTEVSVHHKIECGSLTKASDLPAFVTNLFCEEDGLELLCTKCHSNKHPTVKKKK